jgi:hypothetical protein
MLETTTNDLFICPSGLQNVNWFKNRQIWLTDFMRSSEAIKITTHDNQNAWKYLPLNK